jgi:hypothetical protein
LVGNKKQADGNLGWLLCAYCASSALCGLKGKQRAADGLDIYGDSVQVFLARLAGGGVRQEIVRVAGGEVPEKVGFGRVFRIEGARCRGAHNVMSSRLVQLYATGTGNGRSTVQAKSVLERYLAKMVAA